MGNMEYERLERLYNKLAGLRPKSDGELTTLHKLPFSTDPEHYTKSSSDIMIVLNEVIKTTDPLMLFVNNRLEGVVGHTHLRRPSPSHELCLFFDYTVPPSIDDFLAIYCQPRAAFVFADKKTTGIDSAFIIVSQPEPVSIFSHAPVNNMPVHTLTLQGTPISRSSLTMKALTESARMLVGMPDIKI